MPSDTNPTGVSPPTHPADPAHHGLPPSIAHVLEAALQTDPDREAVVARSGRLTYRELDAAADRVARSMWALGVRPGAAVAASLPNDLDIVVLFHAAMRLGAMWIGVNRQLAPPEKRFILDDGGATILFADPEVAAALDGIATVTVEAGDLALARGAWARPDRPDDASDTGPDLVAIRSAIDPFAPAALAYTSGTTGRPKGVVHSQYNLLLPGAVLGASRGYDAELRKGDCLPLTILNMLVLTTLLTAQCRGTCIIMDRLDSGGVAEWVRDERISTWNGVPAILSSLASDDSVAAADLASLDEVWSGGDSCPEAIESAFVSKFGHQLTGSYGLTEAPTVVTIDPRGVPRKVGASGRPLPHLVVTIRDDVDRELPVGDVGDVCVEANDSGPWAGAYRPMLGYLGRPDATAEAMRGGRLRTGDIGSLDADGYLTIRSRRSALIIRGGANVYPAEVERVIAEVAAVTSQVVFGVPDERLGQRVAAAVEIADGESADDVRAAILDRCRAELAKYKVPDDVVVTGKLPRNAMGKVERAGLAALVDRA